MEFDTEVLRAGDLPQRVGDAHVVDVRRVADVLAGGVGVAQVDRLDGGVGFKSALDERGFEWADCLAVAGGAFGEKSDAFLIVECGADAGVDALRVAGFAAINKHRASALAQHADDWPSLYVGAGDKAGDGNAIDGKNIKP